jgi:TRAP-type mannitol/chloroaromatic compound transport system permease large subunit
MLRAGYNIQVSAGAITAGGCLGILIPPSVLLIVYGATAGVSVVQLYAGAFFPGIMLATLYVGYIIVLAKLKPALMPPLAQADRHVKLPPFAESLSGGGRNAFSGLLRAAGGRALGVPGRTVWSQLFITLLPLLVVGGMLFTMYRASTTPVVVESTAGLQEMGGTLAEEGAAEPPSGLIGLQEPGAEEGAEQTQELSPPPAESKPETAAQAPAEAAPPATAAASVPAPIWFWIVLAVGALSMLLLYWLWTWQRLEIFKMLLASFFPLALLIIAVLGSIVFGLATPAEAAAVGAFGGFLLTVAYRFIGHMRGTGRSFGSGAWATTREVGSIMKDSSFLTAKTSAMVCWLFVGSSIFSASFALLGGQDLIEKWVLSLGLTPLQFMILAQCIIFILGWPLEWTEIIVIFMPIFIPLLPKFGIDPLFFGLLVALNLQTAFLSPPVAMAAFYLKGVAPPHVTLNQIFGGMLPFMGIQVIAIVLLYLWPQIGLWLPSVLYAR